MVDGRPLFGAAERMLKATGNCHCTRSIRGRQQSLHARRVRDIQRRQVIAARETVVELGHALQSEAVGATTLALVDKVRGQQMHTSM